MYTISESSNIYHLLYPETDYTLADLELKNSTPTGLISCHFMWWWMSLPIVNCVSNATKWTNAEDNRWRVNPESEFGVATQLLFWSRQFAG